MELPSAVDRGAGLKVNTMPDPSRDDAPPNPETTQEFPGPAADPLATQAFASPAQRTVPQSPAPGGAGQPGSALAGFHLLRQVGAGAMGTVYHARHVRTGREVALKLLSPERA